MPTKKPTFSAPRRTASPAEEEAFLSRAQAQPPASQEATQARRKGHPPQGQKRLNVNVSHDLWRRTKMRAAEEGRTVTDIITEVLEDYLVSI